jgi:hypothetical protein
LITGPPTGNPNPAHYEIIASEQIGKFTIVVVHYPDCTNYEGRKILVFENTTLARIQAQGSIDPHFSENTKYASPIARFEPTKRGVLMAKKLCALLEAENV